MKNDNAVTNWGVLPLIVCMVLCLYWVVPSPKAGGCLSCAGAIVSLGGATWRDPSSGAGGQGRRI